MSPYLLYLSVCMMLTYVERAGGANSASSSSSSRSQLTLEDNGYRNLVIAINDRVPENPQLIERIKSVFEEISGYLYSATK